jgi:hypothetical protein
MSVFFSFAFLTIALAASLLSLAFESTLPPGLVVILIIAGSVISFVAAGFPVAGDEP